MYCDVDVILVWWDEKVNLLVVYCCLKVYLFNRFVFVFFVFWLDYIEGESEDLGRVFVVVLWDVKR